MVAAIAMIALVALMWIQATQAQDGEDAEEARMTEELRKIRDSVERLNQSTWWAFWGSFLIGIAVVATAIGSSWRYARHLSRQVRQAADHFEVIERDMRDRKRPRLSWTECVVREIPDFGRPMGAQTIVLTLTNAGDVSATQLSGSMVSGMAKSIESLGDNDAVEIQMGAILPNATKNHLVPVDGTGDTDPRTGNYFRFKITLWYSGIGKTRHEYSLSGALVGKKIKITEIPRPTKA